MEEQLAAKERLIRILEADGIENPAEHLSAEIVEDYLSTENLGQAKRQLARAKAIAGIANRDLTVNYKVRAPWVGAYSHAKPEELLPMNWALVRTGFPDCSRVVQKNRKLRLVAVQPEDGMNGSIELEVGFKALQKLGARPALWQELVCFRKAIGKLHGGIKLVALGSAKLVEEDFRVYSVQFLYCSRKGYNTTGESDSEEDEIVLYLGVIED